MMGSFSIWHWLIVLVVVVVLFGGGGKISGIMGDLGKGIKSMKKNLKEDDDDKDTDAIAEDDMQKVGEKKPADKKTTAKPSKSKKS